MKGLDGNKRGNGAVTSRLPRIAAACEGIARQGLAEAGGTASMRRAVSVLLKEMEREARRVETVGGSAEAWRAAEERLRSQLDKRATPGREGRRASRDTIETMHRRGGLTVHQARAANQIVTEIELLGGATALKAVDLLSTGGGSGGMPSGLPAHLAKRSWEFQRWFDKVRATPACVGRGGSVGPVVLEIVLTVLVEGLTLTDSAARFGRREREIRQAFREALDYYVSLAEWDYRADLWTPEK